MKVAVLDFGTIFAKIFKTSPVSPLAPPAPSTPSSVLHGSSGGTSVIAVSSAKAMTFTSSSSSLPGKSGAFSSAPSLTAVSGSNAGSTNPILVRPAHSSNLITLTAVHPFHGGSSTSTTSENYTGRTSMCVPERLNWNALNNPHTFTLHDIREEILIDTESEGKRDIQRKGLYKGIPNHHFHGKTVGSLPTLFTKHVLGAIESYHSDCSASVSSSGQTTQVGLNNSWPGIQSYATGLSTERSSVYSWRDDEFDRVNTQKVHQLLWDVAEMLFEGKVSSRTQGLQMECKEWTKHSPHLRILGSQLVLPRDEGFQHVQKRTSSSKTIPSPSFLDSTSDMKELCLWGQKLVATHSPVHSALGSRETSCSDPSLYSFLEEEIYEVDGKIEEYFAFDTKEIDDEGLEFRKIPKKCNRGVPPVSPNACIKDAVTAEVFDDVWRDVVEIIGELIRKHWENELTDEDTQMVNLETPGGKLLPVPASHVTVDTFSITPSRGSESRSTSFWSNVIPSQASCMSSSFHSSLKGVMTIQAKPLQQRHAGLTEKTLCNQDEKHLSMGPSVLTSARNRLGRLQDHSILSSSKRMQTAACKPVAQRKLTVLSSDALQSKTRNAYRDEVLTGTKLKTGTGCLSSPSVHTTRKKHLPPIHLETLENNLSVPRNLLRRGRYPHSRESRAVPESTGQQPLGERPIALDHSSRPNTTHTFRSDTPFKRSFTPLGFACRTRTGRGSCTADHAGIGVTGVSVGVSCSGSSNFSEPLHHQQRQLLNHTFIEGEEEKCQPPWGPHQPRALNRNLTYGKKKFQMVSSRTVFT